MSTLIEALKASKGKKAHFNNGILSVGFLGCNTHRILEVYDDHIIMQRTVPNRKEVFVFNNVEIRLAPDLILGTNRPSNSLTSSNINTNTQNKTFSNSLAQDLNACVGWKCSFINGELSVGWRGTNTHTIAEVFDDRVVLVQNSNPNVKNAHNFNQIKIKIRDGIVINGKAPEANRLMFGS